MVSFKLSSDTTTGELHEIIDSEIDALSVRIQDVFSGHNVSVIAYALAITIGRVVPAEHLLAFLTDVSDLAREANEEYDGGLGYEPRDYGHEESDQHEPENTEGPSQEPAQFTFEELLNELRKGTPIRK